MANIRTREQHSAAIWIMAAVGIMIGVGRPLMGFGLAVLVRAVLVGVRRWELRHLGGLISTTVEVLFDPDHGKTRIRLNCTLEEFHVHTPLAIEPGPVEGICRTRLKLQLPRRQFHELLNEIAAIQSVKEILEGASSMTDKHVQSVPSDRCNCDNL